MKSIEIRDLESRKSTGAEAVTGGFTIPGLLKFQNSDGILKNSDGIRSLSDIRLSESESDERKTNG